MLSKSEPIWAVLIFGTFVCLLFVGFIFVFVSRYQQKMLQHQVDILRKDEEHQLAQIAAAIKAQEREQRRIAQELHDGVGSNLSGIVLALKAGIAAQDAEMMKETVEDLQGTIEQVRSISHNLIPRMLDDIGLNGVLYEMCKLVNKAGLVKATFEADEELPKLPIEKQLLLYRIIQELVQNALKHSGAKSISIKLNYTNHILTATVHDDGCGFDGAAPGFTRGIGLKNIENRALLLDAVLEIYAAPGKGTTAIVKFSHT